MADPGPIQGADDAALGDRLRAGDADALGLIYERYMPSVYDFVARLVRDQAAAEDLTQTTFLRIWERRTQLRDPGRLRAWVFAAAHHLAMDHFRRDRPSDPVEERLDLASGEAGPEETVIKRQVAELVWAAASSLEPRQYAILDLSVRRGLSTPEVAEVLGLRGAHAAVLTNRAREALGNAVRYLLVARRRTHCEQLAALVPAGVRALSAEQRSSVDHHMRRCVACRELASRLASPLELLGALPLLLLPEWLRERGRDQLLSNTQMAAVPLSRGPGGSPGGGTIPPHRRWARPRSRSAIVMAAVLLIALGMTIFVTHHTFGAGGNSAAGARQTAGVAAGSPKGVQASPSPALLAQWVERDMTTNGPGETVTPLADGRVLVAGGGDSGLASADAVIVDGRRVVIEPTGSMLVKRSSHAAALLHDGRVLVVGGAFSGPPGEIYDPATGTWAATPPIPGVHLASARRLGTTAVQLASAVLTGSGGGSPLGSPGDVTATTLQDGRVLVVGGGFGSGYVRSPGLVVLFNPTTNHWSLGPTMKTPRHGHAATLLADGSVLVAGGRDLNAQSFPNALATAELYIPSRNAWVSTSPMPMAFESSGQGGSTDTTSARLGDGRVVVFGFRDAGAGSVPGPSAIVFNPSSGNWTRVNISPGVESGATWTVLTDGRVMFSLAVVCDPAFSRCHGPYTIPTTSIVALFELEAFSEVSLPSGGVLVLGPRTSTAVSPDLTHAVRLVSQNAFFFGPPAS